MAENNPIKKDTQEEIENKINEEKTDSVKKGNKITKQDIIASLAEMKLIELNELVKAIEEHFNVTASAPVMMQAASQGDGNVAPTEEEEVNVILTKLGDSKIAVIKAVAEITEKPLMEAKKLVEGENPVIKEKVKPEEAEKIKEKLVAAGAGVEIK
ncbi:50S ribosomal protein L7/L12 [Spiroplasma endosymbiont of Clivina fossor]|uniref:50S ribosomal protein L7/L12 n=1 Tax=Spiroplasma endosymbiont of Clivina fossor TaxID=3066282 RepID=UPI00313DD350